MRSRPQPDGFNASMIEPQPVFWLGFSICNDCRERVHFSRNQKTRETPHASLADRRHGKFVTLRCRLNSLPDYLDGLTIHDCECVGLALRTVYFDDEDAPTSEDLAEEMIVAGWFEVRWHPTSKVNGQIVPGFTQMRLREAVVITRADLKLNLFASN